MEIVGAATGEATKSLISHLEHEIGYLVHFNRNFQNLKTKIDQLIAARDNVQRLIDAALNNNQVIRESVQTWQQRVKIVQEEANQLSDEAGLVNNWFKGWCCDRFSLGRKANKKNLIMQALLEERNTFGDIVSNPKPIQSLEFVFDGDFDAFVSRESTTKKIIKALKDGNIGLIGVFGMPGVGKTKLIEVVSNKVKEERVFDEVIMVTVSQNPDLEKIQDNIAKRLDLRFDDKDDSVTKKAKLNDKINCRGKKTLVVLDDVWERLEIVEVGIQHKNINKDCTVVFTTRFQGVCGKMESDVSIEVTTLTEEESWQLFRKRAGDAPPHNSILPEVAKDIAKECKGLPLAIATLGRALQDKGENVWNNALRLLRKSIFDGMSPVYSSIKMSYDFLGSKEMKMCFLFCCLYPEDYKIDTDNIFYYVMGEKLLRNADTFMNARSIFDLIIDELVSSCLLLREGKGYVMLHDVVRDVAISIASAESSRFIVKAGMNLTEWSDVELGNCNRLSLMSNKITGFLPYQIKAPNLLTLCLNRNFGIKEIPSGFFEGMQNLTTLDLSDTRVKTLPLSFSCLRSLRVLCMDNCEDLVDISQIGRIVKGSHGLEILSFYGCKGIQSWESLRKLTTLKMLDLSNNSFMKFLPKEISNLHRLQELRMTLSTDECYSQEVLPRHWGNLTEFVIVCKSRDFEFMSIDFKFLLKESWNFKKKMFLHLPSISVPNWILVLLGWTNGLFLKKCLHLKSVDQLDPSGMFDNLKVLSISICKSMTHLYSTASCEAKAPMYAFRNLEILKVVYCPQMEKLVQLTSNATQSMSSSGPSFPIFSKLRELHIWDCFKLKYLLPMRVLRELRQLEILVIWRSYRMVMIVEHENYEDEVVDVDQDKAILPRLKSLDLRGLFELMSFCPLSLLFDWPALEYLRVMNCSKLKRLPLHTNSAPKLKTLELHLESGQQWFDGLEWEDENLKSRLQPLVMKIFN